MWHGCAKRKKAEAARVLDSEVAQSPPLGCSLDLEYSPKSMC
jgi:hypothetical protein